MNNRHIYDVLIIGSGLGGLVCAYILSKNGYKVAVLRSIRRLADVYKPLNGLGLNSIRECTISVAWKKGSLCINYSNIWDY